MAKGAPPRLPRIQAEDEDPFELLFARGVTDGLPAVPPTAERVRPLIAIRKRSWGPSGRTTGGRQ